MVRPEECIIGFGIPLSEEAFRRHLQDSECRDFVKSQRLTWEKYRYLFADPCAKVLKHLQTWGVTVVEELTLPRLTAIFLHPPRVIILFAHWSDADGTVELAEGLVASEQIAAVVPGDYAGIFDLCVCHPRNLVVLLKEKCSDCLVKFTDINADALSWIYLYEVLFKILSTQPTDYFEALANAFKTLSDTDESI